MNNNFAKLPLETILSHWTNARVLDHLVAMKPFDFTIEELAEILKVNLMTVYDILNHFKKFELVETVERKNKDVSYRLAENPRTFALHDFMHQTVIYYLEKSAENIT